MLDVGNLGHYVIISIIVCLSLYFHVICFSDVYSKLRSKYFKPMQCNSEFHRNSFFPRTIIDWNHLDDSAVS